MKISLNWIQEISNVDIKGLGTDEILRRIGAQLGAIEETIDLGARYEKIVVAKIIKCADHPDADRLHVCTIDDGGITPDVKRDEQGYVQVVCGAPNAREGLTVAWLPPGSTVPSSLDSDPFVLEARELRGVVSNGMLASPAELAMSDVHDGILEIEEDVEPGTPFKELYGLDDVVIDLENKMFTHRPDCFGQLGVARELAGINGLKFQSPDWYRDIEVPPVSSKLTFSIENEIEDLVPRFAVQVVEGVSVHPSPVWLQALLTRVGIKPINNIVDLTNYYMHLSAQPTHAYDYDKVKALSGGEGPVLMPRRATAGEKLTLLGGKTINLHEDDVVISTDKKVVGLAGIMGGAETEVDANTKNVLIEAATFDMYAIRRSSMRHGLFTEASSRFNKGQSTWQVPKVQLRLVSDICEQTGAVAGAGEETHLVAEMKPVIVSVGFINQRLGSSLSGDEMKQLLENVEFKISLDGDQLHIEQPFWRMDIENPEDIVEEVGRLYDFGKLPVALPRRTTKAASRDKMLDLKQAIRRTLVTGGANEIQSYSFVHENLFKKTGQDKDEAYHIRNALSPDLQYYRLSLTPSLLEKIHPNIKSGYDEFAIFEMGRMHVRSHGQTDENVPKEIDSLAFVYTASDKIAKQKQGAAYYDARYYLEYLCKELGITNLRFEALTETPDYPVTAVFEHTRSALVYDNTTNEALGIVGEYRQPVLKALKLPKASAGFEVGLDSLLAAQRPKKYIVQSRFPKIEQDISLKIPSAISYAALAGLLQAELATKQPEHTQAQLVPLDLYRREDDKNNKQAAFRLSISSLERTLTSEEVNALLDKVAAAAKDKFGAVRL